MTFEIVSKVKVLWHEFVIEITVLENHLHVLAYIVGSHLVRHKSHHYFLPS